MIAIIRAFLWTIPIVLSAAIITLFYPILFIVAMALWWILILAGIVAAFKILFDKILKTYKTYNIYHKK
jgi:hypothetical protein